MVIDEIVEHIPSGLANKEVYASKDCGDKYITNEDKSI
jgi:hypothetical protein